MKLLSIVGTRPQFIKAAVIHQEALRRGFSHEVVSTGQHHDEFMARIFFDELDLSIRQLPLPQQEAGFRRVMEMEQSLLPVLEELLSHHVLVYGDCDSTLSAAMAARRSGRPFTHIESGVRVGVPTPEEYNRFLTDHLATHNIAFDEVSIKHLKSEGLSNAVLTEDPMKELLVNQWAARKVPQNVLFQEQNILVTCHRDHNVDDEQRFASILEALTRLCDDGWQVIWPVHPRADKRLKQFGLSVDSRVCRLPSLSYHEMLGLLDDVQAVVTDSGGVQREAHWLGLPVNVLTPYRIWGVGQNIEPEELPSCLSVGKAVCPPTCQAAGQILDTIAS